MSNTGFKGVDVRQTGSELVFDAFLQTSGGALVTSGTTNFYIMELQSDGTIKTYDFNSNTFTTGAVTTENLAGTYRKSNNGTTDTGLWTATLSTLTAFTVGAIYLIRVNNSAAFPTDQMRKFQFGSAEGDLVVTAGTTGNAYLRSDATKWLTGTIPTPNTTGVPIVDLGFLSGTAYVAGAIPAVAAGANGGLMTTGSNVGPWSVSGGIQFSNASGDALKLVSTGGSGNGLNAIGNGAGAGISGTAGITGPGMSLNGGATSGTGLVVTAANGLAVSLLSGGIHHGVAISAGSTGDALHLVGGTTSGAAINLSNTSGNVVAIAGTVNATSIQSIFNGVLTGDVQGRLLGGGSSAITGIGAQVDVEQWHTGPVPTPNVSGVPIVDVNYVDGLPATTSSSPIAANITQWLGGTPNALVAGNVQVDVAQWLGATPGTLVSGSVPGIVEGYASGEDPATLVLDVAASSHNTGGSIGAKINAAASAGDPWSTVLPGTYVTGEAGYILGHLISSILKTPANPIQADSNGYVTLNSNGLSQIVPEPFAGVSIDLRQAIGLLLCAACYGVVGNLPNSPAQIFSPDGTKERATIAFDSNNNRLTIQFVNLP